MKNNNKTQGDVSGFKVAGGRVGVLLIHSLGGTPVELRIVAQALAREGYTVHCPRIGGLSAGTDVLGLSTWKDWYAGVCAAHDELSKDCDVVYVGGLSAGSMLALKLASERPDRAHGILLFAPTIWPNGWSIPWTFQFFKLVHHKWFARLFRFKQREPFGIKDERIRNFVLDSFRSDDRPLEDLFSRGGGMVLEFRRMVADVKKRLGSIRQHTLMFHPRFDDQSALSNAMLIQKRLGGLVETCVLDDSYHIVTLDRQRSYVVDRTIEFTRRLTSRIEEQEQVARLKDAAAREAPVKAQARTLPGPRRT